MLDSIHLAPPEIVDYQNIDAFKFTGDARADGGNDELLITNYLARFDGEGNPVTLANLRTDKVRTKAEDHERFFSKWPVYKCVCAEVELDDVLYVLAAGEWYAVVQEFVDRINNEVELVPLSTIELPAHRAGETETAYNERASAELESIHLFDRALVQFQGERGRVEFCDLLTEEREIVHVKKRSKSALLSHLFMQGYVSAEAFVDHHPLRDQIRERVPGVRHLIPEAEPNPSDYQIVFALLHEGRETLPFFSKIALAGIYKQLRRMQFQVGISWIGLEEEP